MTSSLKVGHLTEPALEFGGGGKHIDMRYGLASYGPVDFSDGSTRTVRLGLIGSVHSAGKFREWLRRCEDFIPGKQSNQPTLFPDFPGASITGPFRCYFEVEDRDVQTISTTSISRITAQPDDDVAVQMAVDEFCQQIQAIAESEKPPNVIICALPLEIIERVSNMRVSGGTDDAEKDDEEEEQRGSERGGADFRGALKAKSLGFRIPIQIVWPSTYDNDAVVKRKLAAHSTRRVQDEATRAWNFFCALYYKSGGTPWRMIRDNKAFDATFLGISFYESLDGTALMTSSAQLFDERGEGLILKGALALKDKLDRQPYMSEEDAFKLAQRALQTYKQEHRNYPARLVIHKSSRFHPQEMKGLQTAVEAAEIDIADFLWFPRRSPVRLLRNGIYPPLRGTTLRLDDSQSILYTNGSVDFFRTYPGMYIPNPLTIRAIRQDTMNWDVLLAETLALTKMNWNRTQFDGALPITLKAAHQVGEILKYVPDNVVPDPRYRFYM